MLAFRGKDETAVEEPLLRGFFFFLEFLEFFGLGFFHLLFQIGALFGLDLVALLALDFELLFGAEEFDEGLFRAVALLESSPDDAQIAALAVAVARRDGLKEPRRRTCRS